IDAFRLPEPEMTVCHILHVQRLDRGRNFSIAHGEPVRRVVEKAMASCLRFQRQGKCRVARDMYGGNMIHLDRDLERHGYLQHWVEDDLYSNFPTCQTAGGSAMRRDSKKKGPAFTGPPLRWQTRS